MNEFRSPEPVSEMPNPDPKTSNDMPRMAALLLFSVAMLAATGGVSLLSWGGQMFGGEAIGWLQLLVLVLLAAIPVAGSMPLWRIREGEGGWRAARRTLPWPWYGFGLAIVLFIACQIAMASPSSRDQETRLYLIMLGWLSIGLYCAASGLQVLVSLVLGIKYRYASSFLALLAVGILWVALGIGVWTILAIAAAC